VRKILYDQGAHPSLETGMKPLGILSICLITLALQGKAWSGIYATGDAEEKEAHRRQVTEN
jgi:hypothetical protein